MQEALVGDARPRDDVIEGTQPPTSTFFVPQKPVISEMVVIVASKDVEKHPLEQLVQVVANVLRTAVKTHPLRELRIRHET
jgi:hypothetical protein